MIGKHTIHAWLVLLAGRLTTKRVLVKKRPCLTYLFSVRPVLPRSVHDHRRLKEGLLAIYTYQVRFFEISAEFMTAVRTKSKKAWSRINSPYLSRKPHPIAQNPCFMHWSLLKRSAKVFRRKTWGSQDKWASLMSMQNNNNKSLVFDTGIPRNILRQILFIFRSSQVNRGERYEHICRKTW